MIVPLTLALPCRLLTLDVLVGPPEGVTPLEDLVARGILAAGQQAPLGPLAEVVGEQERADATMSYLTTLFGVPQRVIMEVVGTLWGKGHLTVDFESGGIQLTEAARATITSQRSLAAGGELQTREFLFEPVTGMILSAFHAQGRASETSIRFPLRPQLKVSDIPPAELVSSVQTALRNERQRRGRINVLGVSFGSPALQSAEKIVWLEADAVARRDPDNDRIQFTLSETARWSQRSQQRLNSYFDRLMSEEPTHPVVRAVAGQAQVEREPPEDLDDLFHRMRRRLENLEQTELDQVQERHKWLSTWAAQIGDRLEAVRRSQAQVSLIIRPEGHAWTVTDLIDSARRQLVLVVPDPDPAKVRPCLPTLRRALDRGVQVVFVWGSSLNERLNPQVENLLDELYLRPGARLLRNRKSAKTEGCVVIQDDCRAIVGSHSSLGYQAPDSSEVSVLIEPAEDGPDVPMVIADLLQWTKDQFDPWVLAQKIEQAGDLGGRAASAPAGADVVSPLRPDRPSDPMSDFNAAKVDATSLALWAAGWNEVYAGLTEARHQLTAKVAAVELVRDAEHRTLLWEGLRDARHRLVISDDRLNSRSASPAVARNLRERRAAGAVVHVLHPEPPRSEPSLQDFAALARGPHSISVHHQRVGGRLVIADDRVVLGSFSPFDDRHGEGIGRRVTRVGVHIRRAQLAEELADLFGVRKVEDAGATGPATARPAALSGAEAGISLLLEARSVPPQEFGQLAASRLLTHQQPFEVLASWRDSGIPAADLRRVVAGALYAGLGPAERAEPWLDWLIEDAWSRQAYVEGALLSRWEAQKDDRATTGRRRPLQAAALLAAALETGPLAEEMAAAVFDLGDSRGATTAGAAALACDVLVWGQTEHRELLGLLKSELSPAWRDFCGRVESFGSAPLPLSRLTAHQNRAERVRSLEERRTEIIAAIDRIEALRNRFSFDAGIALHGALFRQGGLLQRIRAAARAGTAECQELAPHLPRDVRRYLDEVVAGTGEDAMEWLKHINFLRKIEDLISSLRAVAAAARDTATERRADDHSLVEALDLGRYLGETWDDLYAAARECGKPYELPAMRLLAVLNPLALWAKEQQ